ncbi:class I SAM-dependent methyltransferase [Psychrosphaera sp. B3R10]|uniref:class I SAM-dependent methyltransferase n=1 Tax=unclassified Psychrosphaera TaxID=2641570 RepID=UPI001C082A1C|nr:MULTISPECIES: class I SAM-dependent methyltransferase [unclassified Psychrosphaera]MBU2883481.1 class I SAM-dependent methyltransferase [Psychrosphaera sp. I2R16]MBU2990337.1 class I SAM-dependent methyltransferase [Psychrosphaera sp. B3R10]
MQTQKYWDNYWQQGHITSFGNEIMGTYSGAIKHFWQRYLGDTQPNTRLLDMCSGNGALPMLFLQFQPKLSIVATDLAQLDEAKLEQQVKRQFPACEIEFKSRVDCTAPNLNGDKFDIVTSQFGIEYAPLEQVIPAAYDLLNKHGKFAIITHVYDSRFIKQNTVSWAFVGEVRKSGLTDILRAQIALEDNNSPEKVRVSHQLQKVTANLKAFDNVEYGLLNIDGFIQMSLGMQDSNKLEQLIALFDNEMLNYHSRLSELVKASRTEEQLSEIVTMASNCGFTLQQSHRVQDQTGILGHGFVFIK